MLSSPVPGSFYCLVNRPTGEPIDYQNAVYSTESLGERTPETAVTTHASYSTRDNFADFRFFTARRYASAVYAVVVCLSVSLSVCL